MNLPFRSVIAAAFALLLTFPVRAADQPFTPLFPKDGAAAGWKVMTWNDVSKPAGPGVEWKVIDGVLHGSEPRGTWLVSDREYGDFVLEFEWKIGERGNSGCGLRFPGKGDPAFDGIELQMVDPRYYPDNMVVPGSELTAGLYRALAPTEQRFKPNDWNQYRVTCKGPFIKVELNGATVLETNLDEQTTAVKRHDNSPASALKDRPRKGRIGFQELSRGGDHVQIRNARIQVIE
jgi:hypothetical protein